MWAPISCHLDTLKEIDDETEEVEINDDDKKVETPSPSPFAGEGRIVETDFGPQAFVLINVYIPNAGERPERPRLATKIKFLKSLKAHCEALASQGRRVLLVGDFNVCADERDVHPRIGLENAYSQEERDLFLSFLTEQGGKFVDTWRHLHPDSGTQPGEAPTAAAVSNATDPTSTNPSSPSSVPSSVPSSAGVYTVWDEKTSARAFNEGVRIDFILATENLVPFIKSCEILGQDVLPPKWSDHAGILVEIEETQGQNKEESLVEVDNILVPPAKHPPCKEWVKLNKRFNDPSQRSILSMFGGANASKAKRKEEESGDHTDKKRQK